MRDHAPSAPLPWPALRRTATGLLLAAALAALPASPALALSVTQVTPQGEVSQVNQVVVGFDGPAVAEGDTRATAPFVAKCSGTGGSGNGSGGSGPAANPLSGATGRWNSAKEWVLNLSGDLPPGVACTLTPNPAFKPRNGQSWSPASYAFNTGGPFVRNVYPWEGAQIDEDQYFVLRFNGEVDGASLQRNAWCEVQGLGERIPVQRIEGAEREATLKHRVGADELAKSAKLYQVLRCQRRFTSGSEVKLHLGAGVSTPSGLATKTASQHSWQVRAPFVAEMNCQRENAQAGCSPLQRISLQFSSPLPWAQAKRIALTGDGSKAPKLDAGESTADGALVTRVYFEPPFAERKDLRIELPSNLRDAAERPLSNAGKFPLVVRTGPMPTLLKFAAAPFGVVERHAEGPGRPALLPLTVRGVEAELNGQALNVSADAQASQLRVQSDKDIIRWFLTLQQYEGWAVPRSQAAQDSKRKLPPVIDPHNKEQVETRVISLLAGREGVQTVPLPKGDGPRQMEVIGMPLGLGYHVVEVSSERLGKALLDPAYGEQRPMVVRTGALVTNMVVHMKLGRESSLAWVTTLDKGQPVAGAQVQVSTCKGKAVASGVTDAQGLVRFERLSPQAPSCDRENVWGLGYFVSARTGSGGGTGSAGSTAPEADMTFTWTSWQNGIEPWRFGVNTNDAPTPSQVLHTVFDRTLLRAGETVSMKHVARLLKGGGKDGGSFGIPAKAPAVLTVQHLGSGDEFPMPVTWRKTATGGLSAESSWAIPKGAKLGAYQVIDKTSYATLGVFRVEEFRLPVMKGQLTLGKPKDPLSLVAPGKLPVAMQVGFLSGGPAAKLAVDVSALIEPHAASFADYPNFSFTPPSERRAQASLEDEDGDMSAPETARVITHRQATQLNAQGEGQTTVDVPPEPTPRRLRVEASYQDPNGETQTLSRSAVIWPAGVIAGVRTPEWVSVKQEMAFDAIALDLNGKPQAGVHVFVKAVARTTTSTRKRLVGGFYGYDSHTQVEERGTICTGKTDAQGLLACKAKFDQAGELELIAVAADAQGRESQAATSVWVTAQGELWFGGENHDRMDLLPEKRDYQAGDTAVFQVRMPFREAQALVSVEREGILHTEVVTLSGKDPTVKLQIKPEWGPNVYVSVLAVRGRLYDVPWYSFFTWGYKTPVAWWRAFWGKTDEYVPATAMVDLSKPAYRLGMAMIRVDDAAHAMQVKVSSDQARYDVRGKARLSISATLPNGQPAAHAEVALAVVDQALLELQPNPSWQLLKAMMTERAWGVATSTAQMEVIGRRHYGRKALPPGGDGGAGSQTRELFDTLIAWQPTVQLDAQGRAEVEVTLNDSLSSFTIAAVADSGAGYFGTGEASIRTTQDLQLISGVPPLLRSDDQFEAGVTARNTTDQPMSVKLTAQAPGVTLAPRELKLAPGESQLVSWSVTVPPMPEGAPWPWLIEAVDSQHGAKDALRIAPQVVATQPVTVQQASLQQLAGPISLTMQAPPNALRGADGKPLGGVQISVAAKLADNLPGLREWWQRYPYACIEQRSSKAIGLNDAALWQSTLAELPTHFAHDGLPTYFPASAHTSGSDVLAAYLLAVSHEKAATDPRFQIPAASLARLQAGLINFVEGRVTPSSWNPAGAVGLAARKLAAVEALSRYGKAQPRMLDSVAFEPNRWPTSALIDWMAIAQRMPELPGGVAQLPAVRQVLQARLQYQGSRIAFSTEREDNWHWTMSNADSNAARLITLAMRDPVLQAEVPRLVTGLMARSQRGHWSTTTANAWAQLSLDAFSTQYEREPVSGHTQASLSPDGKASVAWSAIGAAKAAAGASAPNTMPTPSGDAAQALPANAMQLPWAANGGEQTLRVTQDGSGKPWVTVQSRAAVPITQAFNGGFSIQKSTQVVDGGDAKRGAVLRVTLKVTANADMSWVALSDPVPAGATILGSGLGRDSAIASQTGAEAPQGDERAPSFVERKFDVYRAYYAFVPKGSFSLSYTVRLNNAGQFGLPPTRVEALYAPEMFGETPNARLKVAP